MAYTFFKAEGGNIGSSLCEDDRIETAKEIMNKAAEKNSCLHLPSDSIIADKFAQRCKCFFIYEHNYSRWMDGA